MSEKYVEMWKNLGLDLKAHDQLMQVLGKFYQDIYLSQENRPAGMDYFNFVMSEVHGLRIKELMNKKEQGKKIFGSYCIFVPEEMILSVDGTMVGLCAGAEMGFEEAEKYLPRNTCSLIKSFFGFTLTKVCPYVEVCDSIIGETTCDGKKKAYDIFRDFKNLYVMEIPQMKKDSDRQLWISELQRFKNYLEKFTERKITVDKLKQGINIVNNKRKAINRIMDLRKSKNIVISGKDALLINQVSFYDDPERFTDSVNKIADELEEKIEKGISIVKEKTPRILVSGCPMAVPNWKLPHIIESNGAIIVGEESCVGMRNIRNQVNDNGNTVDELIENIVDRYMKIDCACFTPNEERIEHIVQMAKDLNVDGVIQYSLQFCTPYMVETHRVDKALEKECIPTLKIDTDYSMEDVGQLSTRIQAFLEMLS